MSHEPDDPQEEFAARIADLGELLTSLIQTLAAMLDPEQATQKEERYQSFCRELDQLGEHEYFHLLFENTLLDDLGDLARTARGSNQ